MKRLVLICASVLFSLCAVTPLVWAVDKDDDIKPEEESEHIAFDGSKTTAQSADVEKKLPDEATAIREMLAQHVAHAMSHDLEAYMADFLPETIKQPELEREYAKRAMALEKLDLQLRAIEFAQLNRRSAIIHTRQLSTYLLNGQQITDDAIISYRLVKDSNDNKWKISFSERKRLVAP